MRAPTGAKAWLAHAALLLQRRAEQVAGLPAQRGPAAGKIGGVPVPHTMRALMTPQRLPLLTLAPRCAARSRASGRGSC